jgi:hypothetical protein
MPPRCYALNQKWSESSRLTHDELLKEVKGKMYSWKRHGKDDEEVG